MDNENKTITENNEDLENNENQETTQEEPTLMSGLKSIGFGILILGVAWYFYYTMTGYENGETIRMNTILLLAYKFLGKTITVVALAIWASLYLWSGIVEIKQAQETT